MSGLKRPTGWQDWLGIAVGASYAIIVIPLVAIVMVVIVMFVFACAGAMT